MPSDAILVKHRPRIFTKVVSCAMRVMAEEGIWCLPYLDDFLIVAPTREECLKHSNQAIESLKNLGMILNANKSRLEPSQVFEWLGLQFNLKAHSRNYRREKPVSTK